MLKHKRIIGILVLILALSLYFNYNQYRTNNSLNIRTMNTIQNNYIEAAHNANMIYDLGYKAMVSTSDSQRKELFLLILEAQDRINRVMIEHYNSYIQYYQSRRVYEGLNYLSSELLERVIDEGWTEEYTKDFEVYLIDYSRLSNSYATIRELDYNRNHLKAIRKIEEEIARDFNKYIEAYKNPYELDRERSEEIRRESEYDHEKYMEQVSKLEPQAIENAKKHLLKLMPNYKELGYEVIGLTQYNYKSSSNDHELFVEFINENKDRNTHSTMVVCVNEEGKFNYFVTNYTNRKGLSKDVGKIFIDENITPEMAIELAKNNALLMYEHIDGLEIAGYDVTGWRMIVYFDNIMDGIITNIITDASINLHTGLIEYLGSTIARVDDYGNYIEAFNNIDFTKVLSEETARESIGKQNKILEPGRLYFRYDRMLYYNDYDERDSQLLYRYDVKIGERRLRVYIDAYTGEEVNIELYKGEDL